jgi:hypothetical protein
MQTLESWVHQLKLLSDEVLREQTQKAISALAGLDGRRWESYVILAEQLLKSRKLIPSPPAPERARWGSLL